LPLTVIDAPAMAVVVDPSNPTDVYVGTDVGCWKGIRTGTTTWNWTLYSAGLPEAVIADLKIFDQARLLRAATHGRGLWEIDLTGTTSPSPDLYLRVDYADDGRIVGGSRHPWVWNLPDPTKPGFILKPWMSPDIKVRRSTLANLPVIGSPADFLDFEVNVGDYVDSTTDTETADISNPDTIYVEVHNRSVTGTVPGAQVRVWLMLADASTALPPLPTGYATQINAPIPNGAWLQNGWEFAEANSPYKSPMRDVEARVPQVVSFSVPNITQLLSLPNFHYHICVAAFVTTPTDQVTASDLSLLNATMVDKHIAFRNVHLVPAGARPVSPGADRFSHEPQTMVLDLHNPTPKDLEVDITFERQGFPGHLSVMLPPLPESDRVQETADGFRVVDHAGTVDSIREFIGETLERVGEQIEELGEALERHRRPNRRDCGPAILTPAERRILTKLASIDRRRLFVADSENPEIRGLRIPAGGSVPCAIIVQAPEEAVPGDRYWFSVVQRDGREVMGGSSYVVAVTRPAALDYV
jgi:hypothetical protein